MVLQTIKTVNVDVSQAELAPVIDIVQGDRSTRSAVLLLYDSGAAFVIPEGVDVTIMYHRPDGHGGAYDRTSTGQPAGVLEQSHMKNRVRVYFTPEMLTVPGEVMFSVVLNQGQRVLHSFPLRLNVIAAPGLDDLPPEGDYINIQKFVPQPKVARVGEFLKIKSMDNFGTVTETESSTAPVPITVEEETDIQGWHVRKWSTGAVEMWGTTANRPTVTPGANFFPVELPVEMVGDYQVQVVPTRAGGMVEQYAICGENGELLKSPGNFVMRYLYNSSTAYTCYFDVFVAGKWK